MPVPRRELNKMSQSVQKEIGPNWFACVMGTGIVANAGVGLPLIGDKLHHIATGIWLLASALLFILIIIKVWQTCTRPYILHRQLNDPVMAQFFGAPPMAILTVSGGTLLFGDALFSEYWVLNIAWSLWIIGTVMGLLTTVIIPFRLFTRFEIRDDGAFGGWLMPVVPPMVSSAIGAMFIPSFASIEWQQGLFYLCYALFGISLMSAFIIITLIWSRLAHSGTSSSARVPTLWIVLGPLGQSITAAGALGSVALIIFDHSLGQAFKNLSIMYGLPVWGFAIFWSVLALLLTIRALKRKMPFALTWWAFTFPVGTCVTGTTQLALYTKLAVFDYAAITLFIGLLIAWSIAAIGTSKGLRKGNLLFNATKPAPIISKKGN